MAKVVVVVVVVVVGVVGDGDGDGDGDSDETQPAISTGRHARALSCAANVGAPHTCFHATSHRPALCATDSMPSPSPSPSTPTPTSTTTVTTVSVTAGAERLGAAAGFEDESPQV
jgi:hypothetical protein